MSSHPNSFVSLINFVQCGIRLKYPSTYSAVASRLPPPANKATPHESRIHPAVSAHACPSELSGELNGSGGPSEEYPYMSRRRSV